MKKIKRTKFLCLGAISLVVVSLVSVAFSQWIIAIDGSNKSFSLNVNVEGHSSETIIVEASSTTQSLTMDSKLNEINGSEATGNESTFNVSISNTTIIADDIYNSLSSTNNGKHAQYTFSLTGSSNSKSDTDYNKTTPSSTAFNRNTSTEYTFLDLGTLTKTLNKSDFKLYTSSSGSEISGFYSSKIDLNNTIKYGSYFSYSENVSPSPDSFYNYWIKTYKAEYTGGEITTEQYLTYLSQIDSDMENFKKMTSITISIKLEIVDIQ